MIETLRTSVVVIGAGPVGLAAAIDLNYRGIATIVVETRKFKEPPSVKSNHVSARTMEAFRRLGVAQKVREAGLPADYPNDISLRTTMTGWEIGRIPIPARQDRYTSRTGPDTDWATPEPPHRINQTYLEPVLAEHVSQLPFVTLMNETELHTFSQTDSEVEVEVVDTTRGTRRRLVADFLIGADGARSLVRKQIGATLAGDAVLQNVQSTAIRAPGLYQLMPEPRAWGYYTFNPRRNGHVYAIDGREVFLIHNHLGPGETLSSVEREASIREILGVGEGFKFEMTSKEDWTARRLLASHFRQGRAFICGDAAHLWVPYGGYGMNAGIADALNLTWNLAGYLDGWGGASMLDAYEAERLPITDQVSKFAMGHQKAIVKVNIPANIEDDSTDSHAARILLGAEASKLNTRQFAAAGLNFGYVYDESSIICYDEGRAPEYSMDTYTPSTVPGCRAPHFWLAPGESLYDQFGHGYTLIRLSGSVDPAPLLEAAKGAKIPMTVITVPRDIVPEYYSRDLTLCREDQHVAWRGDTMPDDIVATLRRLAGSPASTAMQWGLADG